MTPNKLPPLPDSLEKLIAEMRLYSGDTIEGSRLERLSASWADRLEALRQSQSLPAGAVAVVTDEQIVRFMSVALRHTEYKRGTSGPSVTEIRQGLHMAGIAALQADAREKGEAVAWQWRRIDPAEGPSDVWNPLAPEHVEIMRGQATAEVRALYATQPAQASEADKVLRKVWSILGPLPAPICNGCADELTLALEAMRDYLGSNDYPATSSQETASE